MGFKWQGSAKNLILRSGEAMGFRGWGSAKNIILKAFWYGRRAWSCWYTPPTPPVFRKDVILKGLAGGVCKRCDSKGVISNEFGRVKWNWASFFRLRAGFPRNAAWGFPASGLVRMVFVFTVLLGPYFLLIVSVCPPNISSVTSDQDESCELPAVPGGGSPNQRHGHVAAGPNSLTGISA